VKFTLEQINAIHDSLGSAKTLALYVQELSKIGVKHADSYLTDGHSEFFGTDNYTVRSPAVHDVLSISDTTDRNGLMRYLALHDSGKIGYIEMSKGLAESGIEKWVIDTSELTMTFYNKAGDELRVDHIR
jgi:uncharacterized protein YbcV (DUF1398 family)